MHERRGTILAVVILAACSPTSDEGSSPSSETQAAARSIEQPAPGPSGAQAKPGTTLPASDATFRYVGRWAESTQQCRDEAWTFTRDRLTAPDHVSCTFSGIEKSPGGYAIDAMCTTGGEEEEDNLVLRFAESAKAMLVEGASSLPETGLVYCGEVP